MSKLVLKNVGKSYGHFEAVKDFSLELAKGEFRTDIGEVDDLDAKQVTRVLACSSA